MSEAGTEGSAGDHQKPDADAERASGAAYGFTAYLIWGSMPLYVRALTPSGAWEILVHRILWSLLCCLVLLAWGRGLRELLRRLREPRVLGGAVLAGLLISVNWVVYLVAVTTGRITEAALGYFLNPLVSVALGLLILHERLRPLQAVAVAVGAVAGLVIALDAGAIPVIPLVLAFSFGTYGLVKNRVGVGLTAVQSLTAETAVLAPAAAAALAVLVVRSDSTFAGYGAGHAALLASTGLMTAIPLLLFGAAARRVTLTTVGLLQFVAPVLQFLAAIAVGEHLSRGRWFGFAIVWCALALLIVDLTRHGIHRGRQARAAQGASPGHRDLPLG